MTDHDSWDSRPAAICTLLSVPEATCSYVVASTNQCSHESNINRRNYSDIPSISDLVNTTCFTQQNDQIADTYQSSGKHFLFWILSFLSS